MKVNWKFVAMYLLMVVSTITGGIFMVKAVELADVVRRGVAIASSVGHYDLDWVVGPAMSITPWLIASVIAMVMALVIGVSIRKTIHDPIDVEGFVVS